MKKNQKKTFITLAVIVLVVLGLGIIWVFGRSGSIKQDTGKDFLESGQEASTSETSVDFTKDKKEKPLTGENHSLIDVGLEYASNYDRVVFSFASNAKNQAPGYIAELNGKVITIRFYDTREVDMNMDKVYEGESEITGEGKVIEKVELWYPRDDSSIGAKIYLKSAKGFRVSEENLFLSLDVECGCGG